MWTFDMLGSVVLVLALATVLLMVLVARTHKSGKDLPIWFGSGLAGMLLGAAALAAGFSVMGYEVLSPQEIRAMAGTSPPMPPMPPQSSPASSAPAGGGPGAGGPPGGMGMMGGGMGSRQPSSKRQLATLVRKLELLTGDIAIHLTADQSTAVQAALAELDGKESLTEDDAKAAYDKLLGLLDEEQQSRQDRIGLPFRRGGAGGPGAGGPGAGGPGAGGMGGPPGGGMGGAAAPAPDANPFAEEENSKSLRALRERLGGTPANDTPASKTPASKTPAAEATPPEKPAAEKPAAEKPAAEPAKS